MKYPLTHLLSERSWVSILLILALLSKCCAYCMPKQCLSVSDTNISYWRSKEIVLLITGHVGGNVGTGEHFDIDSERSHYVGVCWPINWEQRRQEKVKRKYLCNMCKPTSHVFTGDQLQKWLVNSSVIFRVLIRDMTMVWNDLFSN